MSCISRSFKTYFKKFKFLLNPFHALNCSILSDKQYNRIVNSPDLTKLLKSFPATYNLITYVSITHKFYD